MTRSTTVLAALAIALAGCPGNEEQPPPPLPDGPPSFKVMTQNLYLGANLDAALSPTVNLAELVEQAWGAALATDFPARAKLVADAIQSNDVDLVALQEAALWRSQVPGDGSLLPNATEVAQDFLAILLDELTSRGLDYAVAAVVQNGDIELTGTSGNDYRLTDRDAVLAKRTLPVIAAASGIYPIADLYVVQPPPPLPAVPLPRGWVTVDFRAAGRTIRLLDTHLEPLDPAVAARQAADAVRLANPSRQTTIVAGDMNSAPGGAAYQVLAAPAGGLSDEWVKAGGAEPGLTCCWNPNLVDGTFTGRIDLVFATAELTPASPAIVDETPTTSGGLHASDHAGVVLGFTVQP